MGNGALPHGPSYRAHPRLYRNSPGRCGPEGLLTEVLRNRQRWAVSDNQIDRAQRTSSHVWYRHSPDTCHNEHWQCQDCHHHEFCRYEHKYPHRCPLEYSLPLMRQFENSGKAPKGFPVDTHGMLRMSTKPGAYGWYGHAVPRERRLDLHQHSLADRLLHGMCPGCGESRQRPICGAAVRLLTQVVQRL